MKNKILTAELIAGAILHISTLANIKNFTDEDFTAINLLVEITPQQFEEACLLLRCTPETIH